MGKRASFGRRRANWRRRAAKAALPLLVLALALAWWAYGDRLGPAPELARVDMRFGICGERGGAACVIDGDTLAIGQRRVRLTGYDAPEFDGACKAERAKAREAQSALHRWLARGSFSWTGGEDPPRDRYGRELREARRGDEMLAEHMIGAGLAEGSGWGAVRREWC